MIGTVQMWLLEELLSLNGRYEAVDLPLLATIYVTAFSHLQLQTLRQIVGCCISRHDPGSRYQHQPAG